MEGLGEVLGNKQREVRVVCFEFLALVSMSVYNRQIVVIIFRSYFAGRIRAERADLVVKRRCVVNKLRFIQILV